MDDRSDTARAEDTLAAFARTLAPGATALTFRPAEVRVRPQVEASLPGASIAIAGGASSEETAVFVERMQRAESARGPTASAAEAYEIVAPIGRGGMGEVWRAVQRSLGREIALKQLSTDSPAAEEHFLSEARVTARLSHANIVPVHALGRSGDGRPMLAMKLVKGRSWLDVLREEGGPQHLARHLHVFLAVCNAVAFAHAEGFLHRDLKPANVMVGEFGQVFVVDWGLAVGLDRRTCDESGILFVRDVHSPAGTPAYMAPELALGDGEAQGPHTDVYSLGACLHEIVTGAPPHAAADTMAALRHAVESAPPEYDESVPSELRTLCRRAMARAPRDRYPDVPSLRAAVETFLAHDAARAITEKGLRALARLKEQIAAHERAEAGTRAGTGTLPGAGTGTLPGTGTGTLPGADTGTLAGTGTGPLAGADASKGPLASAGTGPLAGAGTGTLPGAGAGESAGRVERERAIHRTYTEARFAFEHSLESWPEGEEARRGIEEAGRVMLAHAIATEDVALATRLAAEVDDAALRAELDGLRARIAARERELLALREQATLLDDSRVARPLGNVFFAAGLLGGAAAIPTRFFLDQGPDSAKVPITVLWTAVTLVCGAYALYILRGAKKSLISPRVGWTWAAVGVACLAAGVIAVAQGEAPFQNAAYTTTMIGIGFVAQALQTRLWLLLPAATTFVGALAMGFFPDRRVELFGAVWLLSLVGVGVVLRRTGAGGASPESAAALPRAGG